MGILSRIFGNEFLRGMPKYCRYCGSRLEYSALSSHYNEYNGKVVIDTIQLECSSCENCIVHFDPYRTAHGAFSLSYTYDWEVDSIEEAREEIRHNLP